MKITILLFIICINVYSAIGINPVSPYINKGVSLHWQMAYNPLSIDYNYKKKASENKYLIYAADFYVVQSRFFGNWVGDGYMIVGGKEEKLELLFPIIVPFMLPVMNPHFQMQIKINVFEKGESNLFQNISISPFFGANFIIDSYDQINFNNSRSTNSSQFYIGTALGTRKKIIDDFSYIEIFTAPQFSFSYYSGLITNEYTNIARIEPNNWKKISRDYNTAMCDFIAPVGIGLKRRWFSVKTGIAITTTFGGEKRTKESGQITVNSYNLPQIPFFMEIGFHFRKFKRLEKEQI